MKKKLLIIKLILTLVISVLIIINFNLITKIIIETSIMYFKNIFPAILIFTLIANVLINYGFTYLSSYYLSKPLNKLFKINNNSIFFTIISLICTVPSNYIILKDLINKNLINKKDALKLSLFNYYINPLFIYSYGLIIFNKKTTLIILLIHYLSNIFTGIVIRNINKKTYKKDEINNVYYKIISNEKNLINVITSTIKNNFLSYIYILIFIIIFTIISELINLGFLSGFLEISTGFIYLIKSNINILYKYYLFGIYISLGGLSILMQIKSVMKDDISFITLLKGRFINLIISLILLFFFSSFIIG